MNNYEKIRTMSIDDLALFLSVFAYTCGDIESSPEYYLRWLQQEISE